MKPKNKNGFILLFISNNLILSVYGVLFPNNRIPVKNSVFLCVETNKRIFIYLFIYLKVKIRILEGIILSYLMEKISKLFAFRLNLRILEN